MATTTIESEARGFGEVPGNANPTAVDRSQRMPRFFGLPAGTDVSSVLSRLSFVIVGAGAVGRRVAVALARMGVASLRICDPGRYRPVSVLTQPITPGEVGRAKAGATGELCKDLSPGTRVSVLEGRFDRMPTSALLGADAVILATDNLKVEVEAGRRCRQLGLPLFQGSVHGPTLTAQVRAWSNGREAGPCPACGFGREERAALDRGTTYSCDGALSGDWAAHGAAPPTVTPSALASLAGGLVVNQLLRYALPLGHPVLDTELQFNGFSLQSTTTTLRRNPDCRLDHRPWVFGGIDGRIGDRTLRELARQAGMHDDERIETTAFLVDDLMFVERAVCKRGHADPVGRFLPPVGPAGRCERCDEDRVADRFHSHRPTPTRVLGSVLDRPLASLCAAVPQWVAVQRDGRTVIYRDDSARPPKEDLP